jgi:hypothetical protein
MIARWCWAGFAGAFRRSELVALNIDDVTFTEKGRSAAAKSTRMVPSQVPCTQRRCRQCRVVDPPFHETDDGS